MNTKNVIMKSRNHVFHSRKNFGNFQFQTSSLEPYSQRIIFRYPFSVLFIKTLRVAEKGEKVNR